MKTSSSTADRDDVWENLKEKLGLHDEAPKNTQSNSSDWSSRGFLAPCADGQRTAHLAGLAGSYLALGMTVDQAIEHCAMWNKHNTPPLPNDKVIQTCHSIAASDARNHPARARTQAFPALQPSAPLTPLFDIKDARIDHFISTPPPPRRWVLKDFLPLGIVAALVAPGGMGKSQLLLQIAYSVATGIPLAGHWAVGEPGSVLMLCAEDDTDEIHRRVSRIHTQLGGAMDSAAKAQLCNRLFIRSLVGEDVLITSVLKNNEATKTSIADRLALTIKQTADLKLVIIDPAARFRGGDENSNAHATRFVEALGGLVRDTGATLLLAHHSRKAGAHGAEASQHASRGASALSDGIRFHIVLSPLSVKTNGYADIDDNARRNYLEVAPVKTNYTKMQDPVLLQREDDGYLQAVKTTSSTATREQQLQLDLLWVIKAALQPLTARAVEQYHCGPSKPIQTSQKECRALIARTRDDGWLTWRPGSPLKLTPEARALLDANPIKVSAAGTARRRRTPQKGPSKSIS